MTEHDYEEKCHRVHVFCKYFESILAGCVSVLVMLSCLRIIEWAVPEDSSMFCTLTIMITTLLVTVIGVVLSVMAISVLVHKFRIFMYQKYSKEIEH